MAEFTHIGYSDESHWNRGQYRTICLITSRADVADALEHCLAEAHAGELAWKNLRTKNTFSTAVDFCRIAIEKSCAGQVRIDTLIWDTKDSRHNIIGRDDAANLARMYYHLMVTVIERRWPTGSSWLMRPDMRTDMDWETLEDCLNYPSRSMKASFAQLQFASQDKLQQFKLPHITQVKSSDHPLVQMADLIAGLAAFSWNMHEVYKTWQSQQSRQMSMLDVIDGSSKLSTGNKYKSCTLQHFDDLCSNRQFQVRTAESQGLKTRNPRDPINFWFYVPQRDEDKAPRRQRNRVRLLDDDNF